MLRLEKVSKIYSANGLVSTGFSKVDLELKIGEFVAITGESGSGKSTLLNVISGLDSYEEGEMYIMRQPTSGYSKLELEDYRKKYIGNIFQTFNLINSYTVYENVELVMLMSGYSKEEVGERAKDIISKVGLTEYTNTKASKLSGGQKQRVAIARALAKETPIIVADEPTGNLDSKSAAGIIELLHEISKEKLIVIVTHNYDQVEPYVTRKISMNDGRVVEDKKFEEKEEITATEAKCQPISKKNLFRLGVRNTFNIPAKLGLLLLVFVFLCLSVISTYSSFQNQSETMSGQGYNNYFSNTEKNRILVTKQDKSLLTDDDYNKLATINNVDSIVKDDLLLDMQTSYTDGKDMYYITAKVLDASLYKGTLAEGRMPESGNEAIIVFPKDDGYLSSYIEDVMKKKSFLRDQNTGNNLVKRKIKTVGYGYTTPAETDAMHTGNQYIEAYIYVNTKAIGQVRNSLLEKYCKQEIGFADKIIQGNSAMGMYRIIPNSKVDKGQTFIPEEMSYMAENGYAIGKPLSITNKSLYFEETVELNVENYYTKNNLNSYLGINNFDEINGAIFVNPQDYKTLFEKGNYQSSVLVKDTKIAKATQSEIEKAGFDTFYVNDGVVSYSEGFDSILTTFRTMVLIGIFAVLFFITYFIVKLILKSRNVYFSTIRMLGATEGNCKSLLRVELFTVMTIAYGIVLSGVMVFASGIVNSQYVTTLISYLKVYDYFILYGILCIMALLISGRFSKQLFKKTAMNAHKEEV